MYICMSFGVGYDINKHPELMRSASLIEAKSILTTVVSSRFMQNN